jgi:GT2 family glycosyltransferase
MSSIAAPAKSKPTVPYRVANAPSPSVCVIVLSWNHLDDTLACLNSIEQQDYGEYKVMLVDNGSSDNTVTSVRARFPQTQIIENQRNLGYALGNNIGLRAALKQNFDYIFVLNNDTVLDTACISALVCDLESHPKAAAAGPKSFFYSQPDTIYFAGGLIRFDGFTDHVGWEMPDAPEYQRATETEWLTGCAILFRRDALRKVGLFEPRYYLLFEDSDWSLRARRRGYSLRFVPDAKLWHKVSPSFGRAWSPTYFYYYMRNSLLLVERTIPWRRPKRKRFFYQCAIKRAQEELERRATDMTPDEKLRMEHALRQGIRDYCLRRFGQRDV